MNLFDNIAKLFNPDPRTAVASHILFKDKDQDTVSAEVKTKLESGELSFADDAEIAIPDNEPIGISRTITVDEDIDIASLKVTVDIEHSYIGDLQIILERGDTKVTLHDKTGGGSDNLKTSFDVTDFTGQNARGDWTLTVTDNGKGIEKIPASLQRRAHLLKAKLTVERPATGGTCVTLRLRTRKKK